ncbi:AEC family transporter [uncultured Maricaulis sp.]|uniref:AEC family transporter n=1 Tax=uncultured Maricaulis sp. TaxID=174710 RepID=UPI0030DBF321|tara:strand:- start:65341 stop:66255 length:915 start_codon:yes stop_codon:yes gene_type:complete
MDVVLTSLFPIFGVIAVGWALRRTGLLPDNSWGPVSRLAYLGLSPPLLFTAISRADLSAITLGPFLGAAVLGFMAMAVIMLAIKPLLRVPDPTYTSVFQAVCRWNGLLILALGIALFGDQGEILVALVMVVSIPLVNMECVAALAVWGEGASPKLGSIAYRMVTNPLIIGSVAGGIVNVAHIPVPVPIADTMSLLGQAALPLILLSVGAGLSFTTMRARPRLLALSVFLKLMVGPVVFYGIGRAMGLEGIPLTILLLTGSSPGAGSAYVLAQQMGGDAPYSAGDITASTLFCFITIPFWLWLLG